MNVRLYYVGIVMRHDTSDLIELESGPFLKQHQAERSKADLDQAGSPSYGATTVRRVLIGETMLECL